MQSDVHFFAAEVTRFLREFQSITIAVSPSGADERVCVSVHLPYMVQTVGIVDDQEAFARLARRHQDRLKRVKAARDTAPADVRRFLDRHFRGNDRSEAAVAKGRAGWHEIKNLLQAAVDHGLVSGRAGAPYPDGQDLRQWLKTYGIGVDCSAFVQHTLTHVLRAYAGALGNAHAQSHPDSVGWMTSSGVYQEITAESESEGRFERVPLPVQARPGDVLVKRGHMRIVMEAEPRVEGGVILTLAESTADRDIPVGQPQEESDIGPRLIQVWYPEPGRPIRAQTPWWKRARDDAFKTKEDERAYILGRLRALGQFCTYQTDRHA